MAVQVATLDILSERAGFNAEAARAVGDAIIMEINQSRNDLATKRDVEEVNQKLRAEFVLIRNEFRSELKAGLAELKADMARWMFAALIGQTALILSIVYFMLQHLR